MSCGHSINHQHCCPLVYGGIAPQITMPPASRSSKACTECRQVKLRCDSKQNFPDPCSRCKARSLVCTFDPSFKRTPTKGQLERVTKQLNQLQSALGLPQRQPGPDYLQVPQSIDGRTSSADSHSSGPSPPESCPTVHLLPSEPDVYFGLSESNDTVPEVFRLGKFQLPAERVRDLFLHFARYQYKHVPIVDIRRHYNDIHSKTPFLFWTIITVAIRASSITLELLDTIEVPYNDFLGRVVVKSPLSLSSIQSLLLLCCWPFPVRTQRQDPSWNLCNIALSATIHQSLPRKILQKKGWPDEEEQLACRTWLACFYVSSRLSSNLAVAPPLRTAEDLTDINKALAIGGATGDFGAQLEIQRQIASYTTILSSDQSLLNSSSAIQMYDRELSAIPTHFKEQWTKLCEFSLLMAKLHLYTLVILSARPEQATTTSHGVADPQNAVGVCLLKGFHTAIKMISLYSQILDDISRDGRHNADMQPTHWVLPKSYHISFAQATFFLLRFTSSGSQFPESDRDIARNHIRLSHEIYLRISQRPDDEAERAARVIETLSRNGGEAAAPTDSPDLSILQIAARKAAQLRGKPFSYDEPVPEVFANEVSGVDLGMDGTNVPGAQTEVHPYDWQYGEGWLPSFNVPNEIWDIGNHPGVIPTVGDWPGTATVMNYSTF